MQTLLRHHLHKLAVEIGLACSSGGAPNHAHLRSDTVEWISLPHLAEVVLLATQVATGVESQPPEGTRNSQMS
jgi:hypothetical protein